MLSEHIDRKRECCPCVVLLVSNLAIAVLAWLWALYHCVVDIVCVYVILCRICTKNNVLVCVAS